MNGKTQDCSNSLGFSIVGIEHTDGGTSFIVPIRAERIYTLRIITQMCHIS